MTVTFPRIAVTMGDPSGIGPLVTVEALRAVQESANSHNIVVIGSGPELERAAQRMRCSWSPYLLDGTRDEALISLPPGRIGLIEPPGGTWPLAEPGHPDIRGGLLQLACVDTALELALRRSVAAVVTGPVSKIAITRAGKRFTGHTEHLAEADGRTHDDVTMMFAGPTLRVALVTTHLPLKEVSGALTVERVFQSILRVVTALRHWWRLENPRLAVLGLNPHAGEEGLFGGEEEQILVPAIKEAQTSDCCAGATIEGPLPSEVGLRHTVAGNYDCVLAHYHDQATIPSKLLDMGRAVNVTLGLSFLRTSVDHGVAYDAAVSGEADSGSMQAALRLAMKLTHTVGYP